MLFNRRRRLTVAISLLLVSTVLMGTASFAWFAMNTETNADGYNVEATSDSRFLQISDNNQTWGTTAAYSSLNAKELNLVTYKEIKGETVYKGDPTLFAPGTRYDGTQTLYIRADSDTNYYHAATNSTEYWSRTGGVFDGVYTPKALVDGDYLVGLFTGLEFIEIPEDSDAVADGKTVYYTKATDSEVYTASIIADGAPLAGKYTLSQNGIDTIDPAAIKASYNYINVSDGFTEADEATSLEGYIDPSLLEFKYIINSERKGDGTTKYYEFDNFDYKVVTPQSGEDLKGLYEIYSYKSAAETTFNSALTYYIKADGEFAVNIPVPVNQDEIDAWTEGSATEKPEPIYDLSNHFVKGQITDGNFDAVKFAADSGSYEDFTPEYLVNDGGNISHKGNLKHGDSLIGLIDAATVVFAAPSSPCDHVDAEPADAPDGLCDICGSSMTPMGDVYYYDYNAETRTYEAVKFNAADITPVKADILRADKYALYQYQSAENDTYDAAETYYALESGAFVQTLPTVTNQDEIDNWQESDGTPKPEPIYSLAGLYKLTEISDPTDLVTITSGNYSSATYHTIYWEAAQNGDIRIPALREGALIDNYYTVSLTAETAETFDGVSNYFVMNGEDYVCIGTPERGTHIENYLYWGRAYSDSLLEVQEGNTLNVISNNIGEEKYYLHDTLYLRQGANTNDADNLRVADVTIGGASNFLTPALRVLFVAMSSSGEKAIVEYDAGTDSFVDRDNNSQTDDSLLLSKLLGDAQETVTVEVYIFFDGTDEVASNYGMGIINAQTVSIKFAIDELEYNEIN